MTDWKSLRSIERLYSPGVPALLFTTAALVVLELVLPIVTMQVYDRAIAHQAAGTLAALLGLGLCALVLELIIRHSRTRLLIFSGFSMTHQLGQELVKSALTQRGRRDTAEAVGKQIQSMNSLGILREFHGGQEKVVYLELLFVPVLLAVIAMIAGWVALVPAALLLIFAVIVLKLSINLRRSMQHRNESDGARYEYIIDILSEIHSVKSLALEQVLSRDYERLKAKSTADGYDTSLRLLALFDVSALFNSLITLGTITAGAAAAVNNNISAGGLIACILLSGRLMKPVRRGLALFARAQDYKLACSEINAMLDGDSGEAPQDDPVQVDNNGKLEVEGLRVSAGGKLILDGVGLTAKPGDVIHIDGAKNSGKSVLLRTIAGGMRPDDGAIRVGGTDIDTLRASERNRLIGYLQETGTIYRGTIAENLTRFGESDFQSVLYVVRLLGFEKDIATLPGGMETRLEGNDADSIPPGLKQRIAFGRSLASRPKLILFDSADAGLDRAAYEAVYRLFCRLRKVATIILVTDDEYLRSLANRNLLLENGHLTNLGNRRSPEVRLRRYKEIRL